MLKEATSVGIDLKLGLLPEGRWLHIFSFRYVNWALRARLRCIQGDYSIPAPLAGLFFLLTFLVLAIVGTCPASVDGLGSVLNFKIAIGGPRA